MMVRRLDVRGSRWHRLLISVVGTVCALGAWAGLPPLALANGPVITVTTTSDGTGNCPTNCTLRGAIAAAEQAGGAVTVDVPSGSYALTQGELQVGTAVNQNITIAGTGSAASQTVIRQTTAGDRVFDLDPSLLGNIGVTLENMTITGGSVGGFGGGGILAGGITTDSLTLQNAVVTGNSTLAGANGGGIAFGQGGTLTITGSSITDNTATGADGGGISFQADPVAGGTLTITESTISGNQATAGAGAGQGGGLYIGAGGTESISTSDLTSNTAASGGAALEASEGAVTLSLDRIAGNGRDAVDGADTSVTANNDWWGCNAGPGSAPCDGQGSAVHVATWLQLRLLGVPSGTVVPGAHVSLTADLTQNQLGQPAGPLPDNTPVHFAANAGTPNPSLASTVAGQAATDYVAAATAGQAQVTATVDQQSVSGIVTVAGTTPQVTQQPSSQMVCVGQPAAFTAAASGSPTPTVQWQVSTDGGTSFTAITGARAGSYALPAVTAAENGSQYQAVFSNANGMATSSAATLTVGQAPTVTSDPQPAAVPAFSQAIFTAAASGANAVLWQVSSDGGTTWINVPGASANTLTLIAQGGLNGNEYRAEFASPCGMVNSQPATLTVIPVAPSITWPAPGQWPYGVPLNGTVLDATASYGGGPVAGTFNYSPGLKAQLPLGMQALQVSFLPQDGLDYLPANAKVQVQVVSLTSVGGLTVKPGSLVGGAVTPWTFTFQTSANGALNAGQTVALQAPPGTGLPNVAADYLVNGAAPAKVSGGGASITLALASPIGNSTPVTVVLSTVTNPPAASYPASDLSVVTTTDGVPANPTQGLTFTGQAALPQVTQQPSSQMVCVGEPATFTAAASGSPTPAVQWQVSTNGGTSFTAISGATAGSYVLQAVSPQENGSQYQAVFSNANGMATSSAATLTVSQGPVVTSQPQAVAAPAFSPATFTAAASGANAVLWQVSTDGGQTWTDVPGASATTLSLTATVPASGNRYRAVFSSNCGVQASAGAPLTVTPVTPTLQWTPPAQLAAGTPLSAAVLDASGQFAGAPVTGTYVYTPAAGALLPLGVQQLQVTFAPSDAADYTQATKAVDVSVVAVPGQSVGGVSFAPANPLGGATDSWTVGFTTSGGGALTVGEAVYLQGPAGTQFPPAAADYTIGGAPVATVTAGGSSAVLTVPTAVGASSSVQVVVADVVNPSAGTYPSADFTVATSADTQPASPAQSLTFAAPAALPVLSSASPSPFVAGGSITLTGTGFGVAAGSVRFTQGSTVLLASPPAGDWSDTAIRTTAPAGLSLGSVFVAVYTAAGKTSDALPLQVNAPPAFLSFAGPGSAVAGAEVSLSGTVLDAAHQPVAGTVVGLITSAGSLSAASVLSSTNGGFTVDLRLPGGDGSVFVTAQAGTASATAEIAVTAPTTSGSTSGGSGSSSGSGGSASGGGSGLPVPSVPGAAACTVASGSALTLTIAPTPASGLPTSAVLAGPTCVARGSTPATQVVATFQYQASALDGLSPDRLSVYRQGTGGAWTFLPTAVNAAAGTVQAYLPAPGTYAVFADRQRFSDVPTGYWARSEIDQLLAAGVVDGFPGGTFQPDGALTRAQFVKMLDLTLGLPVAGGATPFSDVAANAWYAPYVAAAARAGIVQGVTPTTFAPNALVTREEMAVLLARALHLSRTATLSFSDAAQIAPWASTAVEEAVAAGYLAGFPNGTFQPVGPTTRAQAAKVLALIIAQEAPHLG